jgi:hypothetical protein
VFSSGLGCMSVLACSAPALVPATDLPACSILCAVTPSSRTTTNVVGLTSTYSLAIDDHFQLGLSCQFQLGLTGQCQLGLVPSLHASPALSRVSGLSRLRAILCVLSG